MLVNEKLISENQVNIEIVLKQDDIDLLNIMYDKSSGQFSYSCNIYSNYTKNIYLDYTISTKAITQGYCKLAIQYLDKNQNSISILTSDTIKIEKYPDKLIELFDNKTWTNLDSSMVFTFTNNIDDTCYFI